MPRKSTKSPTTEHSDARKPSVGKDLKNFVGHWHMGLASHLRAASAAYSAETYTPFSALLPGKMWVWISHVAKYIFQKKHKFRDYTTSGKGTGIYPIADRVKISLLGDWGTGTDEASLVAEQVHKSNPDYTIHLGDVYYVGDTNEVKENFLGKKTSPYAPVQWPMGEKGSFALSGNHEMYANGNGYYSDILPVMGLRDSGNAWGKGQWASFFCLENKHWRIVAVDTAYNSTAFDWGRLPIVGRSKWLRKGTRLKPSCKLPDALMAWLASTIKPDGDKRGLILISHHGCYSAFGEWYQMPAKQLAQLIHRPVIWFWGHEHKLTIYENYGVQGGITAHGRCIGHGGMPVERRQHPLVAVGADRRHARQGHEKRRDGPRGLVARPVACVPLSAPFLFHGYTPAPPGFSLDAAASRSAAYPPSACLMRVESAIFSPSKVSVPVFFVTVSFALAHSVSLRAASRNSCPAYVSRSTWNSSELGKNLPSMSPASCANCAL
jgi:hypothetical protein